MIAVRRLGPGIGDMVMVEPTLRKLAQTDKIVVVTDYPDLFTGMYLTLPSVPFGASIFELGEPCPAAAYESSAPIIAKGRAQLFMEACGLDYAGESGRLQLTPSERIAVARMRMGKVPPLQGGSQGNPLRPPRGRGGRGGRIGVALYAGKYGNVLDGWRDYPYADALVRELLLIGDVIWLHTKPSSHKSVHNFEGSLRELMITIASLSVVIAVDNGVAHLAGALSVPLFGLFGPTDPALRIEGYEHARWLPRYEPCGRAYCWYEPCKWRFCLSTVRPKAIAQRVKEFLDENQRV